MSKKTNRILTYLPIFEDRLNTMKNRIKTEYKKEKNNRDRNFLKGLIKETKKLQNMIEDMQKEKLLFNVADEHKLYLILKEKFENKK